MLSSRQFSDSPRTHRANVVNCEDSRMTGELPSLDDDQVEPRLSFTKEMLQNWMLIAGLKCSSESECPELSLPSGGGFDVELKGPSASIPDYAISAASTWPKTALVHPWRG
jgi:hypothetical protein